MSYIMEEYTFVIPGSKMVQHDSHYHVDCFVDHIPCDVVIPGTVFVDFERLYRQNLSDASQVQLRVVFPHPWRIPLHSTERTDIPRLGFVGSIEDVCFPVPLKDKI